MSTYLMTVSPRFSQFCIPPRYHLSLLAGYPNLSNVFILDGDCPHQMPLQNNTSVLAPEKSHNPSMLFTPNFSLRISSIINGSAPVSGLSLVQGMFMAPGMVPFLTQSEVRESITTIESSPELIRLR